LRDRGDSNYAAENISESEIRRAANIYGNVEHVDNLEEVVALFDAAIFV
jgi:hypothetical protein